MNSSSFEQSCATGGHGTTRRTFLQSASALAGASVLGAAARPARADANSRLGVGFIGAGSRAQAHMGVLHQLSQQKVEAIDLVAVCDVYRPRLRRAAERFDIARMYDDHRRLLEDPAVEVVCIATPDHHHGPQSIDAAGAGKHIYCEKPFTHWRQLDVARRAADAVTRAGCAFQLGTQAMSDSAWEQMKGLVRDGAIGRPVGAETGYFRTGDWGERGMAVDDPNAQAGADLNWEAFLGDAPKRPFDRSRFFRWRLYDDYSGGPATDLYPHCLTQVVDILNLAMPNLVATTGGIHRYDDPLREVPDTCYLLAEYPKGVTIALLGTQANDYQGTTQRGAGQRCPVIRGWEGALSITPDNRAIQVTPVGRGKKPTLVPIERGEDFTAYWRRFLQCCRDKNVKTASPVDLALHVQTTLIMASQSLRHHKVATYDHTRHAVVCG